MNWVLHLGRGHILDRLKKIIFLFTFLFFIIPSSAQVNYTRFTNQIDSLLSTDFFNSTIASVKIYDLTTSNILYEKNSSLLLRPASNLKLFTTAAGLLYLGKDFKFNTTAYYFGEISDNSLEGDLFIKGGFDPFFKIDDLDSIIMDLKKLNVEEIEGNIYADVSNKDSLFWGKGWMWDDDPEPSAPYLSSLNINENSVQVIVKPQNINQSSEVIFYPESNYFFQEVNVNTIEGDSSKIRVTRDWVNRKNKIFVGGYQSYKDNFDTTGVNIFRPELFFINLFKEKLNENDIDFSGELDTLTIPKDVTIFSSIKRGLDSVIIKTNKESNNLGAEMILYSLAEKYFGKPAAAENGVKLIDSLITLIGDNPEDYRIVDGSGVSHYNLISANLIIDLLKFMYSGNEELFNLYFNSLPVAGIDGTLEKRMINGPAYNNVHTKTGTLSGVSNVSGYLTGKNGDKIAFSILMQNYVGKSKPVRNFQDSLLTIISLFNEE